MVNCLIKVVNFACRKCSGLIDNTEVDEKVTLDGDVVCGKISVSLMFSALEEECKNKMWMEEVQEYIVHKSCEKMSVIEPSVRLRGSCKLLKLECYVYDIKH